LVTSFILIAVWYKNSNITMKKVSLSFWLIISAATLQAQSTTAKALLPGSPEAAGISAERLSRIDTVLKEYIDKKWLAGATALVAKDGKIVYYKGIGYNDLSTKTPLPKDAIFRIASQTKAITTTGIMMLYEEGKLLLDDAVSNYIPEFKNPKVLDKFNMADTTYTAVPAKREITIRDLLTHTSGIGYAQIGSPVAKAMYYKAGIVDGIGVDRLLLANQMKALGSLPLLHQPGEQFTYGLNTDLLGYLIEVISGTSLDEFFSKRIFEPLGMKDTYFYLPASKKSRLAVLYTEDKDRKVMKAPDTMNITGNFYSNYPNSNGTYFSGGGGLCSTAYDYAVFMQMLLNGGQYNGKRILSKSSVRMMTTNQIGQINLSSGNKFGLGFEIVPESNSGKSPLPEGSFFWGGMFSSIYWIDPKERIVAQLFINQYPDSHTDIQNKFKELVYQAIE